MTKLFLTGDRMVSPIYPGQIVLAMFRAVIAGNQVLTGDNDGVEAIVRDIADQVGLPVTVVPSPRDAAGKVDWDSRHKALGDDVRVQVFHVEPMSSSVVRSALSVLADDRVEIVTPVELLG